MCARDSDQHTLNSWSVSLFDLCLVNLCSFQKCEWYTYAKIKCDINARACAGRHTRTACVWCLCLRVRNLTTARKQIISKWLRSSSFFFLILFCMTRHRHDDVTISIVLQSWNSFSSINEKNEQRARKWTIASRFVILRLHAHDATRKKVTDIYTAWIQQWAICMHANFRFFSLNCDVDDVLY